MASIYDKASLVLIPSGTKTSKVYSQKPTNGDGDFTFSRSTAATRVNASGNIEKETQNLLLQSNQFNTTWIANNATITSGQSGYDGTNDAWLLSKIGTAYGAVYQTGITATNGGVYSFSIYAKANTTNFASFRLSTGSGADNRIKFNLTNGAISLASANNGTRIDAVATDVGNGWYRCSITAQANSTTITVNLYAGDTADTTGSVYVQDAQLEQSLVARTYIETTTAAVYAGITDNLPRLDYSGGASCPSLLLEPSRTNLIDQSEYFGSWLTLNSSATDNAAISPEGVTNAAALVDDATNGAHYLQSAVITHATGEDMMASVFLKKGTRSQARVRLSGGASDAYFNLDDGSVISENGCTATVEDYGNGWYRCAIFDTSAAFGSGRLQVMSAVSGNSTYVGDGTEAIYIYGAQYEHNASYPTSYIPCMGVSATRAKDFINQNIQTLTSGLTEGTLFIEFEKPNTGENNDLMRLRGSGNLGRAYIYNYGVGFASDWGTSQNFTIVTPLLVLPPMTWEVVRFRLPLGQGVVCRLFRVRQLHLLRYGCDCGCVFASLRQVGLLQLLV